MRSDTVSRTCKMGWTKTSADAEIRRRPTDGGRVSLRLVSHLNLAQHEVAGKESSQAGSRNSALCGLRM